MSYASEEANTVTETKEILVFYDDAKTVLYAISLSDEPIAIPGGVYSGGVVIANPVPSSRGQIASMTFIDNQSVAIALPTDNQFGRDAAMSLYDQVNLDVVGINSGGYRIKWRGNHIASNYAVSGVSLSFRNALVDDVIAPLTQASSACWKEFAGSDCGALAPILTVLKESVSFGSNPGMIVNSIYDMDVGGTIYFTETPPYDGSTSCKITEVTALGSDRYELRLLGLNLLPLNIINDTSVPRYRPGCDKTRSDCESYNNFSRFGGFDEVPSEDIYGGI